MSYKPLSQTVTDGQKNPISSDAVNDHVAAEIAAIPAGASLTLDNLTAPTAVNQDLLLDAGKKLKTNTSAPVGLSINAVTPHTNGTTTITTSASIDGILNAGDYIKLTGLTTTAQITVKNSSTSLTVSNALGTGGGGTSREIEKFTPASQFLNSNNSVNTLFLENQALFGKGSFTTGFGTPSVVPSISFENNPGIGFAAPNLNQIAIVGYPGNRGDGTYATERFRFSVGGAGTGTNFRMSDGENIDVVRSGVFRLRFGWYSDTPETVFECDRTFARIPRPLGALAEASQNFFNYPTFGLLTSTPLATNSSSRFRTGAFREKLSVGTLGPYGVYGGILSVKGFELNLTSSVSTVKTDGTNVIKHVSMFAGSTATAYSVRLAGMGTGDKIKIIKSGQPDLVVTITNEATSLYNSPPLYSIHDLTVDQNVDVAYDGGYIVVLPPLIHVRTKDDAVVFNIDYEGKASLDTSLVINESGADKDTRIEGDTDANLVFVDASTDKVGIGTSTPAEKLEVSGNIKATSGDVSIATAGKGLKVAEGSNATMGVATLVAGTVVVPTAAVKSTSRIMLTTQSLGTVSDPKAIAVTARTADQDFTITSADNTDTSVIAWLIINPA